MPSRLRSRLGLLLVPWLAIHVAGANLSPPYPGLRNSDGHLLPAVAPYLGETLRLVPETPDGTMLQRRENFGYSPAEIATYFADPPPAIVDDTGLDPVFLAPPPPPGVHPRVLVHADKLAALRHRLANTESGRVLHKTIREHLETTLLGPKARFAAVYAGLVADAVPETIDPVLAYALTYEAFRCLVEEDAPGGRRVAAAIATFAQIARRDFAAARAKARPGPIDLTQSSGSRPLFDARTVAQEPTREYTLGLAYDFAHPFMTEAQRDSVRAVLAEATTDLTLPGAESLPALHAGASYWVSWSSRLLLAITAIEGEPGYDAATFRRAADAYRRFILTLPPSGEPFESLGKNFLSLEHLVILARRDPARHLLGYAPLRALFNDHLVATALPWGGGFTFWDSNARTGSLLNRTADAAVYHALFPRDRAGDWIYRQQLGGSLANLSRTLNTRHFLSATDALVCAIFATDFSEAYPEAAYAAVTAGRPLASYSPDSGNVLARSAWSPDALFLGYLNRAVAGGHPLSDRSHFNLYSHGRVWSTYAYARDVPEQFGPVMRSVLLADDRGPSAAEARLVLFRDTTLLTQAASDLSHPWNFQTASAEPPPPGAALGTKTRSYNSFRLDPSPLPWMNLPIGELPDWYSSLKPGTAPSAGATSRRDWYQRLAVRHAFRTVALVRGPRPYAVVADDLHVDDDEHRHTWGMTVPDDVELLRVTRLARSGPFDELEILLAEKSPVLAPSLPAEIPRRLLVRVFSTETLDEPPAALNPVAVKNGSRPEIKINRLEIRSRARTAGFRVLLFPHLLGDVPPQASWRADQNGLRIIWNDQDDLLSFVSDASGCTRVVLTRAPSSPPSSPPAP